MIKIFTVMLVAIVGIIAVSGTAFAKVSVRGYYRSSGTYVQPHYRTNADSARLNNWSYYGNTNPYTGKRGYSW